MRRALARCVVRALVVAALVATSDARAEGGPSRVALVRTAPGDRLLQETGTRLRAELREAGFEVVEVDRVPGDARSSLGDASDAGGGLATIAIDRLQAEAYADVWISDHLTGKTVVRRVSVRGERNTAGVLAIRAMELLRASLLEAAAPPADQPMAAPADVLRWVEPTMPARAASSDLRGGTTVAVGVLGLHGTDGLGLELGPTLRLAHGIRGPFVGRVFVGGPLWGPSIEAAGGKAAVRQELAALEVGWMGDPAPVAPIVSLGAGIFHLHVDGSADAPLRAQGADVVSLSASATAGALLRLGPRIAVTAEAVVLLLEPQPVVVVAGRDVGAAGDPSVGVSLGVLFGL